MHMGITYFNETHTCMEQELADNTPSGYREQQSYEDGEVKCKFSGLESEKVSHLPFEYDTLQFPTTQIRRYAQIMTLIIPRVITATKKDRQ